MSTELERATAADRARDADLMRRALTLAANGWGRVAPNPLVGAVIAQGSRVVGSGYHREYGADHAEVEALRSAGRRAAGGTLYVNLEPCHHHGKTPPCTEAILAAGVRRVVIGCPDPHLEAAGGAAALRAAGIEVLEGIEREASERLNSPFLWYAREGTPWVAVKLAMSLDGKIARVPGERTAVTGEATWDEVHALRAGFDAILVGRATVETDDPSLTVRGRVRPRVPPTRVVLDPRLRLSAGAGLVRSVAEAPLLVLSGPGADPGRREHLESAGAEVVSVGTDSDGGFDLREMVAVLVSRGIRSVLVEGGGRTVASLMDAGLVHLMYIFIAPRLFGAKGVPAFPDVAEPAWGKWRTQRIRRVGEDVLLVLDRPAAHPREGA